MQIARGKVLAEAVLARSLEHGLVMLRILELYLNYFECSSGWRQPVTSENEPFMRHCLSLPWAIIVVAEEATHDRTHISHPPNRDRLDPRQRRGRPPVRPAGADLRPGHARPFECASGLVQRMLTALVAIELPHRVRGPNCPETPRQEEFIDS